MSVFFDSPISDDAIPEGEAELLLANIGITEGISSAESSEYRQLLAAVHDVAEHVLALPDYATRPNVEKYPRNNIHRPSLEEQTFGNAWAHKFSIRENENDATVVTRALEAGAYIVGTAICENFSGGSTSGGCALVGGGLVDIAIGADQGGSIRVPSSFCGCVGLKPTHGLVPYTGVSSGDTVNDYVGPIARTVRDVALCLDAISGRDDYDDRTLGAPIHGSTTYSKSLQSSVAGMRIGILFEGSEHRSVDPLVKRTQRIAGTLGLMGFAHGRRGLFSTEFESARQPWTNASFRSCSHRPKTR
ncbi:amidase signature enzyme [Bimuria novae-zelandiae CBS 107.79]|uniref:Amidase signature enzyme n=1 Tax=Bimuria novae-zelandiae CBS 107.79 TaxID=1447943 RepID=A0A6A5VK09_9PLEO|nr:amidase signature enzyme [Bimuria novae-zelandiae CBS 107.79]